MIKQRIYYTILFLIVVQILRAQNKVQFERIKVEDGLASNRVFMSVEDDWGFMWFATELGVVRYDGKHLKTYNLERIPEAQQTSFLSISIKKDRTGKLWLAFNNGLIFYYDVAKDEFIFYDQILNANGSHFSIVSFFIDQQNRYFFSSFKELVTYDPETRQTSSFPGISTLVKSIVQIPDGRIIMGIEDRVLIYDENLLLQSDLSDLEVNQLWIPPDQKVETLFWQDSESTLWIGTESAGLFTYDFLHNKISINLLPEVDVRIKSIKAFDDTKLIVATDGSGIYIYDPFNLEVIDHHVNLELNEKSLSSNAIHDVAVNRQGIAFISTFRGGVSILYPGQQNFQSIQSHTADRNNLLRNNIIYSIVEPKEGYVSFGTDAGVSIWNTQANTWKHLNLNETRNDKIQVAWSQAADDSGDLWISSFTFSINKFDLEKGEKLITKLGKLEDKVAKRLYFFNGLLIVSTTSSGLFILGPEDTLINHNIGAVLDFEPYANDKLLMSGTLGLVLLDTQYGECTFLSDSLIEQTLSKAAIIGVELDEKRQLYVATRQNGVFVFSPDFQEVNKISTQSGLATDYVVDMLLDNDDQLWIATTKGLSTIQNGVVHNYYLSDGLISTDFNRNASLQATDGRLYFGTNEGVITFLPEQIDPPNPGQLRVKKPI